MKTIKTLLLLSSVMFILLASLIAGCKKNNTTGVAIKYCDTAVHCPGVCDTVSQHCCGLGYEGANCATETRAKYLGAYTGPETCTTGTDNYTLTITPAAANAVSVTLSNVYDNSYTATGTISGNTLTVANQAVGGSSNNVMVSGSGQFNGNTLTFTYTVTASSQSNTCTFIGTK